MSFELLETPVVDGTVVVYIEEGSSYSKWTQVEHIVDYGPYDQVFTVKSDANNVASIYFGDGISGQMPVNGSQIRVQYTVGGGAINNVLPGTLVNIDYVPGLTSNELTALQSVITVSNQETALGGSDPEPLSQIRYAAPLALRSNNRAITLQDFANLASQVSGVGKAKAKADVWTSVTLYIAPTRVATDTDIAPGLDGTGMTQNGDPTIELTTISANTVSFLADKTLIGTSVTVQPPTYVDAIITVQYVKFPQYTTVEIETALKTTVVTSFGYTNNDFGQTIYPQDIEYSLQQIPGIKTSKVTALHRQGDSGLTTLVGEANEIFRFQEANISVGSV
jgi:predicted phage baseplate assembly protein